ncbi:MAG: glutaredoxin family protein [Planctomycetales bacterium]
MSKKPHTVLYTRRGCHLCEIAKDLLLQSQLSPLEVDIDGSPELLSQFDHCVPVVEIDGKIRFRGRVDPILLKRILEAS